MACLLGVCHGAKEVRSVRVCHEAKEACLLGAYPGAEVSSLGVGGYHRTETGSLGACHGAKEARSFGNFGARSRE